MKKTLLSLLLLGLAHFAMAQPGGPGGPPCWPPANCVPIDGLSSVLLLAGAAYLGKNRKKFFQ